jgi:hypothetical protein
MKRGERRENVKEKGRKGQEKRRKRNKKVKMSCKRVK